MNEAIKPDGFRVEYQYSRVLGWVDNSPMGKKQRYLTKAAAFAAIEERMRRTNNPRERYRVMLGDKEIPDPKLLYRVQYLGQDLHGRSGTSETFNFTTPEEAFKALDARHKSFDGRIAHRDYSVMQGDKVVARPIKDIGAPDVYAPKTATAADFSKVNPLTAKVLDDIAQAPQAPVDNKIVKAAAKVPLSFLPLRVLKGVARVFGYGAKKYGHGNFILGTDDDAGNRYIGGNLRHIADAQNLDGTFDWASLAKLDDESKLPEIDHAICGLVMLRGILIKKGILPEDPGVGNEPPGTK